MKFKRLSRVIHVESGGIYSIVFTPDMCRLEATGAPAYAYIGTNNLIWVREAKEMEDGRFKPVSEDTP